MSLLFVHALTSIHPGTGQGVGTIDLPVARERATNLPVIAGSTLKGCLKAGGSLTEEQRDAIFGKPDEQGTLRISDARLLLLPVRSVSTTFAWTTSPYLLRRLRRDCDLVASVAAPQEVPAPGEGEVFTAGSVATVNVAGKGRLVMEDLDFEVKAGGAAKWGEWMAAKLFPDEPDWRSEFLKRFAIISDANFDYLCEFATEVNAHISIGEKGVVDDHALWYEETLPAETVLVSLLEERTGIPARDIVPRTLQVGGNATTGQGLARLVAAGAKA